MLNYCLISSEELAYRQYDNIGMLTLVGIGDSILSEQIKIGEESIIFELKTSLN